MLRGLGHRQPPHAPATPSSTRPPRRHRHGGDHAPARGRRRHAGAARHRAGLLRGADLRPHQRLPARVADRHRHHGKKGQLLAEIDTPEVDQELRQAQADLATAAGELRTRAHHQRALAGAARHRSRCRSRTPTSAPAMPQPRPPRASPPPPTSPASRSSSPSSACWPPSTGWSPSATPTSARSSTPAQSPGNALFRVADTHRLRIYVSVPQPYAAGMQPGIEARPGIRRPTRASATPRRSPPPRARSMPARGPCRSSCRSTTPAASCCPAPTPQVHFNFTGRRHTLRVPVNAVLFRSQGLRGRPAR